MARRRIQNAALNIDGLSDFCHPRIHALGHRGSRLVYWADPNKVQWAVDKNTGLRMFAIEDVFKDRQSVLIGCGIPNVYTCVYDDGHGGHRTGWRKMAAYMCCRKEAQDVAAVNNRIQGGVIFELRGLSNEVRSLILHNIQQFSGRTGASCASQNMQMLAASGFTLGNGRSLNKIVRPSRMASLIWRYGLSHSGQPIEFRIVITGSLGVGDHFESVWFKELFTAYRLAGKSCRANHQRTLPPRFFVREVPSFNDRSWKNDSMVNVTMSRPSWLGVKLAFLFGQHPVYSVGIGKLPPALSEPIGPYGGKLSLASKVKKSTIMSPDNVAAIRRLRIGGEDVYEGLPAMAVMDTLSPSQGASRDAALVYNCVVTIEPDGTGRMHIASLKNNDPRAKDSQIVRIMNWYMAKHLLLAGYKTDGWRKRKVKVAYACELWVYDDPTRGRILCINRESGTYKPSVERMQTFAHLLGNRFCIVVEVYDR